MLTLCDRCADAGRALLIHRRHCRPFSREAIQHCPHSKLRGDCRAKYFGCSIAHCRGQFVLHAAKRYSQTALAPWARLYFPAISWCACGPLRRQRALHSPDKCFKRSCLFCQALRNRPSLGTLPACPATSPLIPDSLPRPDSAKKVSRDDFQDDFRCRAAAKRPSLFERQPVSQRGANV